jgi:hypothetical protein
VAKRLSNEIARCLNDVEVRIDKNRSSQVRIFLTFNKNFDNFLPLSMLVKYGCME